MSTFLFYQSLQFFDQLDLINLRENVFAPPRKLSVLSCFCRCGELHRRIRGANHGKRCRIEFAGNCRASIKDPSRCHNGVHERRNFLYTLDWQFLRGTKETIK